MHEDLDIKDDQCAQYVDDIGKATNDDEELNKSFRETFKFIQKTGSKLTMHKGHTLQQRKLIFFGRNHHSRRGEAAETTGPKLPRKTNTPKSN